MIIFLEHTFKVSYVYVRWTDITFVFGFTCVW